MTIPQIDFLERRGWVYTGQQHNGQWKRFEHPIRGHALLIQEWPSKPADASYYLELKNFESVLPVHAWVPA